jgi:dTMP kinase
LRRDTTIISDRFVDSSVAYQASGRVMDAAEVVSPSAWATSDLRPDMTLLLDLDPAVELVRAACRGSPDRLKLEAHTFHDWMRAAFLRLAVEMPERVPDGRRRPVSERGGPS